MSDKMKGITGSTLKWIAIVTMLIDHIGATVLTKLLLHMQANSDLYMEGSLSYADQFNILYWVMYGMRMIGRISFPIFCFLLVEGFQRTHDVRKYMLRMLLFAIVTEVPFDLAFSATAFNWGYQNVMVTMLIGLLTMYGCRQAEEKIGNKVLMWIVCAGCFGIGMIVAEFLHTDYGAKGIIAIMVLYFLQFNKPLQILGGCLSFVWEITAPLAFIPIGCYNGKRGMKMKYFFYLFYPLHLLILYILCVMLGLGDISVL